MSLIVLCTTHCSYFTTILLKQTTLMVKFQPHLPHPSVASVGSIQKLTNKKRRPGRPRELPQRPSQRMSSKKQDTPLPPNTDPEKGISGRAYIIESRVYLGTQIKGARIFDVAGRSLSRLQEMPIEIVWALLRASHKPSTSTGAALQAECDAMAENFSRLMALIGHLSSSFDIYLG